MHPYAIDRMVQERQDELARLARADRRPKALRRERAARPGPRAPAWFTLLAARLGRRADPTPRLDPSPRPQIGPC